MLWHDATDVGKIDCLLDFDCCNELPTLSRTCRKCQYCKSADTVLIHAANDHVAVFIPLSRSSPVKYPWECLSALYKQRVRHQDYRSDCIASREKKTKQPPLQQQQTNPKQNNQTPRKKGEGVRNELKLSEEFICCTIAVKTL